MTLVTVNDGEVQVTGNNLNQTVASGQSAQLTGIQSGAIAVGSTVPGTRWLRSMVE